MERVAIRLVGGRSGRYTNHVAEAPGAASLPGLVTEEWVLAARATFADGTGDGV
ncbi:hypothetical protein GobsT_21690 [Gemmata obscuriglobus]|nr:hypothetical protein GobsT_21690 [Gemmata obscuriglobus]VTS04343.1 unnamed protein product [Gemmata obscuriglobus UQM 2246]